MIFYDFQIVFSKISTRSVSQLFLLALLAHEVGAAEDGQHSDAGAQRSIGVLVALKVVVRQ